jgi:hypothetical protein
MDRASATAIILEVLEVEPERVFEVIANVVCSMADAGRYSGGAVMTSCCRNWIATSGRESRSRGCLAILIAQREKSLPIKQIVDSLRFPASLWGDSYHDSADYLAIFLRKAKRRSEAQ